MAVYLRQLVAGREFARQDRFAGQMANIVYVIGDDQTRRCLVVDPAWDIDGILEFIEGEDLGLEGVLVTHYHPDHVGGEIFGHRISGLAELLAIKSVKVHANSNEADGIKLVTGLSESDIQRHHAGDRLSVGEIDITILHTPGHTPGSQCFLVGGCLVSGDTLFIRGCGRVDLPGGNADQLYQSFTQVLAKLPDETRVYPGHNYATKPVSTIGDEKRENHYFNVRSLEDWRRLIGTG